ncbi:unnamed protein product, partial [Rotaria sp. Silwood2]
QDCAADRYTFEEAITPPTGITRDSGRIIISKVTNDYMSYSYFRPPTFETMTSWSTLRREA